MKMRDIATSPAAVFGRVKPSHLAAPCHIGAARILFAHRFEVGRALPVRSSTRRTAKGWLMSAPLIGGHTVSGTPAYRSQDMPLGGQTGVTLPLGPASRFRLGPPRKTKARRIAEVT
jgi:hypothetical protein